jgi:hypothetical protein
MTTQTTPIIILPPNPPRECVVIDGHRYCRDEELTHAHLGWSLVLVAVGLVYIGILVWQMVEKDRPWLLAAGLLIPMIVTGLVLVVRG